MIDCLGFVVFTLGFFAAITALLWLLTYLEETLPKSGLRRRVDVHRAIVDSDLAEEPRLSTAAPSTGR